MTATSGGHPDYKALGAALEHAGWQQFSFLNETDVALVVGDRAEKFKDHRWMIVSHSCDLIHHSEQELEVELLALEPMDVIPEGEQAKQSPRMRIVAAYVDGGEKPRYFRARPFKKASAERALLQGLSPDLTISLRSSSDPQGLRGKSEREISDWLAARYARAWTPSEFDRRLKRNVGKIQPSLQRLHEHGVEDIFIRVTPMEELAENEAYEASLIILVDPDQAERLEAARSEAKVLVRHIDQPGKIKIIPPPNVELSTSVSYGDLRDWMKFHEVFRDSLAATPANPP